MSLSHGVRTVRDGLVFQYDMKNTVKSWKGEPVTNVITITDLDTGWSQGYNTSIQWNDYRPPVGIKSQVVSFIDLDGNGSGYWYSYGDFAPQDPNTTYSISVYARTLGADWSMRAYTADNSELGRQYTNTLTCPGDGEWHRLEFNPITTPADTQSDSLSFNFTNIPAGQRCWLCAPQMTATSYHVPFVAGTRSNTEAILDISGQNNTATATSLTYNSDGTFSFNGSSDYISVPLSSISVYGLEFWMYNNNAIIGDQSIGGPSTYQSPINFNNTSTAGVNLGGWTGSMTQEKLHIWSNNTVNGSGGTYTKDEVPVGWHHIVFNWNGSTYDIWMDGIKRATYAHTTLGHAKLLQNISATRIGADASTGYYFNGKLSNVKIYSQSLSDTEVLQNFEATRGLYGI